MAWLLPLQTSQSNQQRYQHISRLLADFNAQGPVTNRSKLASRLNFEHVVRSLIDDLGGLKQDGPFNASWMTFCQENLAAEKRIATDDRLDAYERGREDAIKAIMAGRIVPQPVIMPAPNGFDPTRPSAGILLTGQGNGLDTAASVDAVEDARQAALSSTKPIWPASMPEASQPSMSPTSPTHERGIDVNLRLLFEKFLAEQHKKRGDDRARSEIGPIVDFLFDLLGDKPPRRYTMDDWEHLNASIPHIPARTGIPRAHAASLHKRLLYKQNNSDKPLLAATETTITGNYHSGLKRFFGWLVERHYLSQIPPLDMLIPENRVSLPRDAFNDDEILKIIGMPLFTGCHSRVRKWTDGKQLVQGFDYWNFLILLLTGMRPGEVAPLKVTDLKQTDDYAYIDLRPFDASRGRVTRAETRQLKTSNSARIVPLHPLLIDLGLLDHRDHMQTIGETRLFPDVESYTKKDGRERWSQASTKSWQYLKSKGVITRQDVTLYSTRHTMADMIDQLKLSDRTRNRVLGHAGTAGAAGRYGRNGLLSEADLSQITGITSPLIDKMRAILMEAKIKADIGELQLLRPEAPLQRKASDKRASRPRLSDG